jgi:hypothetical protein
MKSMEKNRLEGVLLERFGFQDIKAPTANVSPAIALPNNSHGLT